MVKKIKDMFKPKMENRWLYTCSQLDNPIDEILIWSEETWKIIEHCYNDPKRFYHSMEHIRTSLKYFNNAKKRMDNSLAVEMAIWFHDLVYDPLSKFCEDDSARIAFERLKLVNEDLAKQVHDLVLFTKWSQDHFNIATLDELKKAKLFDNPSMDFFYMRDIDWSGFGNDFEKYSNTTDLIRKEVLFISDYEFDQKRLLFLRYLEKLKRPLYCTPWFYDRYEDTAKENILKEIKLIEDKYTFPTYIEE